MRGQNSCQMAEREHPMQNAGLLKGKPVAVSVRNPHCGLSYQEKGDIQ